MSTQDKKNENNLKVYQLYLDRNKFNNIEIQLENNATMDTILSKYQDQLNNRINSLYNKNVEDCCFLIIEKKTNTKKEDIPSYMEFKVNKKTRLFNLLQNPQNDLYFLPKKNSNILDRQKAREGNKVINNFFEEAETDYFLKKPTEEFLSKAALFLYNNEKQVLTKEKGSVDKNRITIYKNSNRDTIEISIKDIVKDLYYSDTSTAPYRKNLPIKGERPKFYIELQTCKTIYYFCFFKEYSNNQWENAIKQALIKYKNFNIELNLDIKINTSKTSLYVTHHSIVANCFVINNLLFNKEKRKMFLSNFPDRKISAIINNIILYKDLIKKINI